MYEAGVHPERIRHDEISVQDELSTFFRAHSAMISDCPVECTVTTPVIIIVRDLSLISSAASDGYKWAQPETTFCFHSGTNSKESFFVDANAGSGVPICPKSAESLRALGANRDEGLIDVVGFEIDLRELELMLESRSHD